MVATAAVTGGALIMLGWTSEFVGLFIDAGTSRHQNATIVIAVLTIYTVDIAVNIVQACGRSLIVDVLPIPKQQLGTAWAARLGATGHILAYLIGLLDLVKLFPTWLGGDTQFKKMTVVSALFLWIAIAVTSYAVKERVLTRAGGDVNASVKSRLSTLWYQTFHLPRRVNQICWVQFWSWIGWFPVLFYGSTWVGETYFRYDHPDEIQDNSQDILGKIGRLGSTAFVIFSIVNFAAAYFIPFLVRHSDHSGLQNQSLDKSFVSRSSSVLIGVRKALELVLLRLSPYQPSLVTTWIVSNLFFAIICFIAPFVRSLAGATTIIALAGIPWAITVWAPFAEMGIEINRLAAAGSTSAKRTANRADGAPAMNMRAGGYAPVRVSADDEDNDLDGAFAMEDALSPVEQHQNSEDVRLRSRSRSHSDPDASTLLPSPHHSSSSAPSSLRTAPNNDNETETEPELAGLYLGVLNIYTHLPQFIGTGINWLVFLIFETKERTPSPTGGVDDDDDSGIRLQRNGPNAISICLLVGACCSLVAVEAGRRLRNMRPVDDRKGFRRVGRGRVGEGERNDRY